MHGAVRQTINWFNVSSTPVVPDIRLCGALLEMVGFVLDQRIKVYCNELV